ncbi:MAG: hypothetical protein IPG22_20555 [Acidobacteria bacterium]|nr:hypothetical protein [Acidobacteriota bacterium]
MNDAAATSERRINGLAVSHGIGIGRLVFFLDDPSHLTSIAATSPEVEAERISSAAASCRAQLNSLIAANQSGEQTGYQRHSRSTAPDTRSVVAYRQDRGSDRRKWSQR